MLDLANGTDAHDPTDVPPSSDGDDARAYNERSWWNGHACDSPVDESPGKELIEGENKIGTITYSYGDIVVGSADITFNCSKESLTPILSMPEELVSSTQETPVEAKTPLKDTFFKILKIAGIVIGSILVIGIIFLVIRQMVWRRKKRGYLNRRSRFKY